jgi:hypothetical protein
VSAEDTRNLIRQLFCTRSKGAEIVECCAAALKLHALNVSHDDGHLCPLCSLVEQRHLAQVVAGAAVVFAGSWSRRSAVADLTWAS